MSASFSIPFFEVWQPGYGGATVNIFKAGTTTLANVFLDSSLTTPAPNPQNLLALEQGGVSYGKFNVPLYTADSIYLEINSVDTTGVLRPGIVTLEGEDASKATVKTKRGQYARLLEDHLDDPIQVVDFGAFSTAPDSSVTNTATLNAAIGAAAAQGGGEVLIPGGIYEFTTVSLSNGVILRGAGRDATTLRSVEAQAVITVGGDRAGLRGLTLDGNNLIPNGIGIHSIGRDELFIEGVEVKRFDTGIKIQGMRRANWEDVDITNCATGMDALGDVDAGGAGQGDEFAENTWRNGRVRQCTTHGLHLDFLDRQVRDCLFEKIEFAENVGEAALLIEGARFMRFVGCYFNQNTTNLEIKDDANTTFNPQNQVQNCRFLTGSFNGGANKISGYARDVSFRDVEFSGVAWNLSLPDFAVVLIDPVEDGTNTIVGDSTKLMRRFTNLNGQFFGLTLDANPVTAYSILLAHGETVFATAEVVGRMRNGTDYAVFYVATGAHRPGGELNYDNQTVNFNVGKILTGQTTGTTARIVADTDSGSTGKLTLITIEGTFQNNEIITDELGGTATVNGTLQVQNAELDSVGNVDLRAPAKTDVSWTCTFAVSGGSLILNVKGAASKEVEWVVSITGVAL